LLLQVSDKDIKKCNQYAEQQYKTSKGCYARRGQLSQDKITEQIRDGKVAEIAAYRYLRKKGFQVEKPDFTIYEERKKSFGADLTDGVLLFHVKSQSKSSGSLYGISFLFQKSDKLLTAPNDNEVVIMTTIEGNIVEILGLVLATTLKTKRLYKEPKLKRIAETKRAIYWKDVKKHIL